MELRVSKVGLCSCWFCECERMDMQARPMTFIYINNVPPPPFFTMTEIIWSAYFYQFDSLWSLPKFIYLYIETGIVLTTYYKIAVLNRCGWIEVRWENGLGKNMVIGRNLANIFKSGCPIKMYNTVRLCLTVTLLTAVSIYSQTKYLFFFV